MNNQNSDLPSLFDAKAANVIDYLTRLRDNNHKIAISLPHRKIESTWFIRRIESNDHQHLLHLSKQLLNLNEFKETELQEIQSKIPIDDRQTLKISVSKSCAYTIEVQQGEKYETF